MDPVFELHSSKGLLAAGYQPAAVFSNCLIRRTNDVINQDYSAFSAKLIKIDKFWSQQPSHVIVFVSNAYWWWQIHQLQLSIDSVTGMVRGDPVVTLGLPPSLQGWQ